MIDYSWNNKTQPNKRFGKPFRDTRITVTMFWDGSRAEWQFDEIIFWLSWAEQKTISRLVWPMLLTAKINCVTPSWKFYLPNISFLEFQNSCQDLYPWLVMFQIVGWKDKKISEIWKYQKTIILPIVSFDSDFLQISWIMGILPKLFGSEPVFIHRTICETIKNKSSEIIAFSQM